MAEDDPWKAANIVHATASLLKEEKLSESNVLAAAMILNQAGQVFDGTGNESALHKVAEQFKNLGQHF